MEEEIAHIASIRSRESTSRSSHADDQSKKSSGNKPAYKPGPLENHGITRTSRHFVKSAGSVSDASDSGLSCNDRSATAVEDLTAEDLERPGVLDYLPDLVGWSNISSTTRTHTTSSATAPRLSHTIQSGASSSPSGRSQGRIHKHTDAFTSEKEDPGRITIHKHTSLVDTNEDSSLDNNSPAKSASTKDKKLVSVAQTCMSRTLNSYTYTSCSTSSSGYGSGRVAVTSTSTSGPVMRTFSTVSPARIAHTLSPSLSATIVCSGKSFAASDRNESTTIDMPDEEEGAPETIPLLSGKRVFEQALEEHSEAARKLEQENAAVEMVHISVRDDDTGSTRALKTQSQRRALQRDMRRKHTKMCDEAFGVENSEESGSEGAASPDDERQHKDSRRTMRYAMQDERRSIRSNHTLMGDVYITYHHRHPSRVEGDERQHKARRRTMGYAMQDERRSIRSNHTLMGDEAFTVDDETLEYGSATNGGNSSEEFAIGGEVGSGGDNASEDSENDDDDVKSVNIHSRLYGQDGAYVAPMESDMRGYDSDEYTSDRSMRCLQKHRDFTGRIPSNYSNASSLSSSKHSADSNRPQFASSYDNTPQRVTFNRSSTGSLVGSYGIPSTTSSNGMSFPSRSLGSATTLRSGGVSSVFSSSRDSYNRELQYRSSSDYMSKSRPTSTATNYGSLNYVPADAGVKFDMKSSTSVSVERSESSNNSSRRAAVFDRPGFGMPPDVREISRTSASLLDSSQMVRGAKPENMPEGELINPETGKKRRKRKQKKEDINGNPLELGQAQKPTYTTTTTTDSYSRPQYNFESSTRSSFPINAGELSAFAGGSGGGATEGCKEGRGGGGGGGGSAGSERYDEIKKARERKKKGAVDVVKAESIPGNRGKDDIDKLLNFIGQSDAEKSNQNSNKTVSKTQTTGGTKKGSHATTNNVNSNKSATTTPNTTTATSTAAPSSNNNSVPTSESCTPAVQSPSGKNSLNVALASAGVVAESTTPTKSSTESKTAKKKAAKTNSNSSPTDSVSVEDENKRNTAADEVETNDDGVTNFTYLKDDSKAEAVGNKDSKNQKKKSAQKNNNVKTTTNDNKSKEKLTNQNISSSMAASLPPDTDTYLFTDIEAMRPTQEEEFHTVKSSKKKKRTGGNNGGGGGRASEEGQYIFDKALTVPRGPYWSHPYETNSDFYGDQQDRTLQHAPTCKRAFTPPPSSHRNAPSQRYSEQSDGNQSDGAGCYTSSSSYSSASHHHHSHHHHSQSSQRNSQHRTTPPSKTLAAVAAADKGGVHTFSPGAFPELGRSSRAGRRASTGTAEEGKFSSDVGGVDDRSAPESDTESCRSVPIRGLPSKGAASVYSSGSNTVASSSAGSSQPTNLHLPISYAKALATKEANQVGTGSKTVDSPDDLARRNTPSGMGERSHSLDNLNIIDLPPFQSYNVTDTATETVASKVAATKDTTKTAQHSQDTVTSSKRGTTSGEVANSVNKQPSVSPSQSTENLNVASRTQGVKSPHQSDHVSTAVVSDNSSTYSFKDRKAASVVKTGSVPPNPQSNSDFPILPGSANFAATKKSQQDKTSGDVHSFRDTVVGIAVQNQSQQASEMPAGRNVVYKCQGHVTNNVAATGNPGRPNQTGRSEAMSPKQWPEPSKATVANVKTSKAPSISGQSVSDTPSQGASAVNVEIGRYSGGSVAKPNYGGINIASKGTNTSSLPVASSANPPFVTSPQGTNPISQGPPSKRSTKTNGPRTNSSVVFLDKKFETKSCDIGISFGFDLDDAISDVTDSERQLNEVNTAGDIQAIQRPVVDQSDAARRDSISAIDAAISVSVNAGVVASNTAANAAKSSSGKTSLPPPGFSAHSRNTLPVATVMPTVSSSHTNTRSGHTDATGLRTSVPQLVVTENISSAIEKTPETLVCDGEYSPGGPGKQTNTSSRGVIINNDTNDAYDTNVSAVNENNRKLRETLIQSPLIGGAENAADAEIVVNPTETSVEASTINHPQVDVSGTVADDGNNGEQPGLRRYLRPSREEDENYRAGYFDHFRAVQMLHDAWVKLENKMEKNSKNFFVKV